MAAITVNGTNFALDEDGFLEDPAIWTEDFAKEICKTEEVEELTEEHWQVINYLREYFTEFGIAPMVRKLTKGSGCSLKRMYELFPTGPQKGACKIAGLPKPSGCV